MYNWISRFYAKCYQASSTYKALHNPWSHFIFGLWWVSLAEYLLVLRVLFPSLQMVQLIMAIARTAFVPSWTRSEPKDRPSLNVLAASCPWLCSANRTHELDLSYTKGDLRLPWRRYVWVCVRNKFPAGWNRFESPSFSWIVRNSDSHQHRSN